MCNPNTDCEADEYVKVAGDGVSNQKCEPCGTCPAGSYVDQDCTATKYARLPRPPSASESTAVQ